MTESTMLQDSTFNILRMALDGLSLRQQMIGRNIANIDTPGYHAQNVDFETAIKRALTRQKTVDLQRTQPAHLAAPAGVYSFTVLQRPGGSTRADQNNVDIDVELMDMTETALRFQALSQVASKKLLLLKNLSSGR
ncbi:flagellar basal body rod protein FlgB [uncultured Thermanaerothrix sp.]|uniref:flagellar basal body rod protein FlgB n=1 Tax=uncultured Thermanaerothrix sp. TaxID=1195149 RepID=UPI0026120ED6|nr:flagellar basal body rod protein FlgB [uncultured Thermanaerothrix sp.]